MGGYGKNWDAMYYGVKVRPRAKVTIDSVYEESIGIKVNDLDVDLYKRKYFILKKCYRSEC